MGGECVYVGRATSLRTRLSSHRSGSRDLSRSTLRASVAAQELGVPRGAARQRPSVMTAEQIAAVTAWFSAASVTWIECMTQVEAKALEDRLLGSQRPPLNLV
ncbi:GIY-YIG nuclease family protein [Tersicoccus solisilvae]|uniref:GIY-YIG nuclease family protein n=1 Tax=Tersicoccus solisilvae TaxID=1882339 RepID=UPI0034D57CBB